MMKRNGSESAMIDDTAAKASSSKKLAFHKDIVYVSCVLIDAVTNQVKENTKEEEKNLQICKELRRQRDLMASNADRIKSVVSDARMHALKSDLEQARTAVKRLKSEGSHLKMYLCNLKLNATRVVWQMLDEMTKEEVAVDCEEELASGNTINRICCLFDGGGNPMCKYTPLSFREFLMLASPLLDALNMQYVAAEYETDEHDRFVVGSVTPVNGFPISDGALYMLDNYLMKRNTAPR